MVAALCTKAILVKYSLVACVLLSSSLDFNYYLFSFFPTAGYQYYIQARDSSGRTANISYIVKVASPIKFFDVYFRLGFQSNYGESVPTSTLLYTLVEKLSKYMDPNDQVQLSHSV